MRRIAISHKQVPSITDLERRRIEAAQMVKKLTAQLDDCTAPAKKQFLEERIAFYATMERLYVCTIKGRRIMDELKDTRSLRPSLREGEPVTSVTG